jgi:nicotinamidase-related amidase
MVAKNVDLHGYVPEKSTIALILIDVINTMEFPGSEKLLKHAIPMATNISNLKKRARKAGIPVIYVNDNFGKWRSDFRTLVENCISPKCTGKPVADLLKPDDEDYFVLKPKYSGFFNTALDLLLTYLDVKCLIITGMAGNMCVQFTATDAYMRDYYLFVPEDCTASNTKKENNEALGQIRKILKADISASDKLNFKKIIEKVKKKVKKEFKK